MLVRVKSRFLLLITVIGLGLLSGCFQQKTPTEKMYEVLEKVVATEKGYEEQQKPLVTAESKEEKIYNEMIGLGMKQYDQIVKLSNEALALTDQRKTMMEKETESLKKSEEQFQQVKELKTELNEKQLKQQIDQLYGIMEKRYRAHEELYKRYNDGINVDKRLYQMLKDKNSSLDALEKQVTKLNDEYKKIVDANNQFNLLTEQYNVKKMLFYRTAGLKTEKTS